MFRTKIANVFFSKETFLIYPTLTNFTQKKEQKHKAIDLLALSFVSVIVYIHSIRKSFYCTYFECELYNNSMNYIFLCKTF